VASAVVINPHIGRKELLILRATLAGHNLSTVFEIHALSELGFQDRRRIFYLNTSDLRLLNPHWKLPRFPHVR
jgi:hypothetical protein